MDARQLIDKATADLAEDMANPASFSVEGLSQTNRSISERIAGIEALRKYGRRMRRHPLSGMVSHLIPPGTCDR